MGKKVSNQDGPDIQIIRAIINEEQTDIEAIQEDKRIEELVSAIIYVLVDGQIDVSRSYVSDIKRDFKTFLEVDPTDDEYADALKMLSKKLRFIKEYPSIFLA